MSQDFLLTVLDAMMPKAFSESDTLLIAGSQQQPRTKVMLKIIKCSASGQR